MNPLPSFPWLSLLVFLPLAGAFLCVLRRHEPVECRALALATSLVLFGVTLWLFVRFHAGSSDWFLFEDFAWIPRYGIRFTLGLDGLSLLMVLLTGFLQVVAILVSWPVKRHGPLFFALLLLLESGLMGVFLALDMVLFYLFWEVMLIPMFFLIGVWGHERRLYAATKFFLYTLAGSLLMLVALLALYLLHGEQTGLYSFALADLIKTELTTGQSWLLFAGFMLAFAIKTPLIPFHTWLPDAHTEAPTAGSVDLAGLLLKTGVYGLLRIAFPLFPGPTAAFLPFLGALAVGGIFYGAWIATAQVDAKRLVAYSSVSHLGYVILGLTAWNATALSGSILQMVNHGITTGALFCMIGMIDSRAKTRQLDSLGGLWARMPVLSGFFLFFSLASLGLPGLNNFTGEIIILLGTFKVHPVLTILAAAGVVLSAAYMLRLVREILWGPPLGTDPWPDLTLREGLILVPMAILVVWLGLYPATFLAPLDGTLANLLHSGASLAQAGGAP
ncbi:NADH-quinone oxidoreductase subunit M [Desulfuromonas carbonis]